jgi:hypothetical protein
MVPGNAVDGFVEFDVVYFEESVHFPVDEGTEVLALGYLL